MPHPSGTASQHSSQDPEWTWIESLLGTPEAHRLSPMTGAPVSEDEMGKWMDKHRPRLVASFMPRMWDQPHGHPSPRHVARKWALLYHHHDILLAKHGAPSDDGVSLMTHGTGSVVIASMREIRAYGMQTWHLSHDMAWDLDRTSPPSTLFFSDIPMPFPGCIVSIPRGVIRTEQGKDIRTIMVYRCDHHADDGFIVCTYAESPNNAGDSETYHECHRLDEPLSHIHDPGSCLESDQALSDSDQIMMQRIMRISINAMFVISMRPVVSMQPSGQRRRHPITDNRDDVYVPRMLEVPDVTVRSHVQHGTGSSVRMHWRRGHWHTYATGKGRMHRDVKWIRPCLVNAPMEI